MESRKDLLKQVVVSGRKHIKTSKCERLPPEDNLQPPPVDPAIPSDPHPDQLGGVRWVRVGSGSGVRSVWTGPAEGVRFCLCTPLMTPLLWQSTFNMAVMMNGRSAMSKLELASPYIPSYDPTVPWNAEHRTGVSSLWSKFPEFAYVHNIVVRRLRHPNLQLPSPLNHVYKD